MAKPQSDTIRVESLLARTGLTLSCLCDDTLPLSILSSQ